MISLLGMLLMGMAFLHGLAFGTATAVLVAVLAAVTLLPALLGMTGRKLDRLSVHRRAAPDRRDRLAPLEPLRAAPRRRLVPSAASCCSVRSPSPRFAMRLASADAGNDPQGSTTRVAYDRLADGFGPGLNGPLLVVVDDDARVPAAAGSLATDLAAVPGVAAGGRRADRTRQPVSLVTVIPDDRTAGRRRPPTWCTACAPRSVAERHHRPRRRSDRLATSTSPT